MTTSIFLIIIKFKNKGWLNFVVKYGIFGMYPIFTKGTETYC